MRHVLPRFEATELANSGVSSIGLKRFGWQENIKELEYYLEYLLPTQIHRMDNLQGRLAWEYTTLSFIHNVELSTVSTIPCLFLNIYTTFSLSYPRFDLYKILSYQT